MFQCRACVWRYITAIAGESTNPHQLLAARSLILTPPTKHIRRRYKSTLVAATDSKLTKHDDDLVQGNQPLPTPSPKDGKVPKGKNKLSSDVPERQLGLELQFLQDRVKLAEHVHYTLRCEQPEKALDLCRLASKKQDCVVSWNHCINWLMQRGRHDEALKVYNEMKKRAQFPDAYTYSLILSGLAKSQEPGEPVKAGSVTKALSVYYSMDSPTSRVKPNIVHTNNVLKVCKEGLNMDALWGVVARLPENGAGAPNEVTYSIILDAIRHNAFGEDAENTSLETLVSARAKAVHEGRAVWVDVIKKWRNGQIKIDAKLVRAMGLLLRMSKNIRDWDDVLNLVQQTMNIPRQLPALDSPDRHIEHIPQENELRVADPVVEDDDGYTDTPTATAFSPVKPGGGKAAAGFVQPERSTLGMLVEICTQLRAPKAARAYWDLLTASDGPYAIQPELGDYHTLLKLHGKNRASGLVVAVLRQMVEAKIEPSYATFRIAMAVCERDIKNKHNLPNARAIIDIMESTLADPDVPTLSKYVKLVLASDNGAEIVFTIDRLDTIVHNLRSRVTYGSAQTGKSPHQHMLEIEETLDFLKSLIGVMDVVAKRELVPKEERTKWIGRRRQLDAFIGNATRGLQTKRQRYEEEVGHKTPHTKDLKPQRGLRMSESEYGLRLWRYKKRVESVEVAAEQDRLSSGRMQEREKESEQRRKPWVEHMREREKSRVQEMRQQDKKAMEKPTERRRVQVQQREEQEQEQDHRRLEAESATDPEERERLRVKGLFHWNVRNERPDIPTRGEIIDLQNKSGWKSVTTEARQKEPWSLRGQSTRTADKPARQRRSKDERDEDLDPSTGQRGRFADSPMDL